MVLERFDVCVYPVRCTLYAVRCTLWTKLVNRLSHHQSEIFQIWKVERVEDLKTLDKFVIELIPLKTSGVISHFPMKCILLHINTLKLLSAISQLLCKIFQICEFHRVEHFKNYECAHFQKFMLTRWGLINLWIFILFPYKFTLFKGNSRCNNSTTNEDFLNL